MATDDDLLTDYLDPATGFGQDVIVNSVAGQGIYDSAAVLEADNGVITRAIALRITTEFADASAVKAGNAVTAGGIAHKVRQVIAMPPDGAMTQLVLVRNT